MWLWSDGLKWRLMLCSCRKRFQVAQLTPKYIQLKLQIWNCSCFLLHRKIVVDYPVFSSAFK